MKKVAIIGTVGIPANYGGFETLTEYLTRLLSHKTDFTVYCSSKAYTEKIKNHRNAQLVYIPLSANGLQSIFYDIISLFHASRKHNTILILGVSGCIALPLFRLFFRKKKLLINIDGLEHQRKKWSRPIRKFLKFSEKLAIKYGDVIIGDNAAIKNYIVKEYARTAVLIAYGGDHAGIIPLSNSVKKAYSIPNTYAFKVCRIEPENNIHLVLKAFSRGKLPIIIVGNWDNSQYGEDLKNEYKNNNQLILLNPIYDQQILNQIRANCSVYIHGHSAGGTNPSLVEAMNLELPIFAYDVNYNKETTYNKARYFTDSEELLELVKNTSLEELKRIGTDMKAISSEHYCWEQIAEQYQTLFKQN